MKCIGLKCVLPESFAGGLFSCLKYSVFIKFVMLFAVCYLFYLSSHDVLWSNSLASYRYPWASYLISVISIEGTVSPNGDNCTTPLLFPALRSRCPPA